jgi:hypothetical protein
MQLCVKSQPGKIFVHLAYLDDSQQQGALAIFGAVVIPHGAFGWAERMHSIAIEQLFSVDEIEEKFQEFHAYELFKGEGAFKGIDEAKRFDAITVLLMAMGNYKLPFIYAAIDEKKLAKSALSNGLLETAHPLVPAFKLCLLGIEHWALHRHPQNFPDVHSIDYSDQYLLIADETKDAELKKRLRNSYRLLRAARPYIGKTQNRLWHAHDAMYFGDSRDSVGIQLADLCTYFMQRHLMKKDPDVKDDGDEFFRMFSKQIICAKPEPEWSEFRELLVSHDGV